MSRLYQSHTKQDLIKEQDSFSIPFCTLNFNRYPSKFFSSFKIQLCCALLTNTACIYSLWSHVNIHSSAVKMKSGQEGFWEANIRLHLCPKPNERLLRQIESVPSRLQNCIAAWDAAIQIPSQSAACKYPHPVGAYIKTAEALRAWSCSKAIHF